MGFGVRSTGGNGVAVLGPMGAWRWGSLGMGVLRAADAGGVPEMGTPGWVVLGSGTPAGSRYGVTAPPPRWAQVLQAGRFSAVWRGTLQQRPVAIKAFAAGAARRWAAERAVHELPLMEHENVAKLLGTRGAGPCARGGLLVLQLYPAVSAGEGGGGGVWDVGGLLGARMGAHGSASLHVDAGRGWAFVERIAASGRARPWMATCGRAAPQRHRSACSRRVPPGAPHYPQPPPRPSPPRPPQGSLQHFLRQHVSPWAGSVRLALSLARGLAFLHQELWRDGERPPPPPSPHVRPRSR